MNLEKLRKRVKNVYLTYDNECAIYKEPIHGKPAIEQRYKIPDYFDRSIFSEGQQLFELHYILLFVAKNGDQYKHEVSAFPISIFERSR